MIGQLIKQAEKQRLQLYIYDMRVISVRTIFEPPSYQFCTFCIIDHVAAAPGPLACPSPGARTPRLPSRSTRPSSLS